MKVKCKNVKENFKWLINETKRAWTEINKVPCVCRNHKTVNKCYSTLLNPLKEKAHLIQKMGKGTFKLDSLQCSIVTQINKSKILL
jgi:hypothetical protein